MKNYSNINVLTHSVTIKCENESIPFYAASSKFFRFLCRQCFHKNHFSVFKHFFMQRNHINRALWIDISYPQVSTVNYHTFNFSKKWNVLFPRFKNLKWRLTMWCRLENNAISPKKDLLVSYLQKLISALLCCSKYIFSLF